jgi:hypothetical protein
VIFISGAESYFLQAEAVARGWGTGDAQELYENGVASSFLYWGFEDVDITDYLGQASVAFPAAGTAEQQIKAIIIQKWASMTGTENIEA